MIFMCFLNEKSYEPGSIPTKNLPKTVSNKEPLDTKCFYFGWRIPSFPNLDIQSNSVRQILNFLET